MLYGLIGLVALGTALALAGRRRPAERPVEVRADARRRRRRG